MSTYSTRNATAVLAVMCLSMLMPAQMAKAAEEEIRFDKTQRVKRSPERVDTLKVRITTNFSGAKNAENKRNQRLRAVRRTQNEIQMKGAASNSGL